MYTTDFAYDGPIFLVPLSLSYPSSPVVMIIIIVMIIIRRKIIILIRIRMIGGWLAA